MPARDAPSLEKGPEHATLTVETAERRLDAFLARQRPDLSRSFLQRLIHQGQALVNGQPGKPAQRLRAGDQVSLTVPPPEQWDLQPEPVPFEVVYEDADLAVVDKPAGVTVHPAAGHLHGTLVQGLLARLEGLSSVGGVLRPGIVHRLDKDTSGLLLVAKNDAAHRALAAQWQRREVEKGYVALVKGYPEPPEGEIVGPVGRDPAHRQRMAVVAGGREARTHYRTLERLSGWTLVEARPTTGRTHQIRVHFAWLGHPIAGDATYGGRTPLVGRQFLHAAWLRFRHPRSGEWVSLRSPLPEDLREALEALGATWREGLPTPNPN